MFDRDPHEASRIYYGSVSPDLAHELTLLCKGQVVDGQNVVRLSVEDRAAQRRKVGEVVANHKKEMKAKAKQEKVQAKEEAKTALQDRKQQNATQQKGTALETGSHPIVPQGNTGQHRYRG